MKPIRYVALASALLAASCQPEPAAAQDTAGVFACIAAHDSQFGSHDETEAGRLSLAACVAATLSGQDRRQMREQKTLARGLAKDQARMCENGQLVCGTVEFSGRSNPSFTIGQ